MLRILSATALAILVSTQSPLSAQNAAPANTPKARVDMRGRVIRTAPDHFILETRDQKQVTFYVNPNTQYLMNKKVVPYTEVRAGTIIDAAYIQDGDRYVVNSVLLLPGEQFTPVPPTAAPTDGTLVEGEVVRVIGSDQVVIRSGGKEVIVYVTPQTAYKLTAQGGGITELRQGVPVQVYYNVNDRRNVAQRILGMPRRNP